MEEIDVTKVTAIEYLEKLIKIRNEENCNYESDCNTCSSSQYGGGEPHKRRDDI